MKAYFLLKDVCRLLFGRQRFRHLLQESWETKSLKTFDIFQRKKSSGELKSSFRNVSKLVKTF